MGILIECPKCRTRGSLSRKVCKCGHSVQKVDSKNYWVEYYEGGMRRRERIGRSKQAAENRLREIQTAKAEGRHIRRNKNAEVTLGELRSWYLGLSEVRQRRSYVDIQKCLDNVISRLGKSLPVSELLMGHIEKFRKQRLSEKTHTGHPPKPSTINRDTANFRAMLNRAVEYAKLESNPIGRIRQLEENNVRNRVLSPEEFQTLLGHCPEHIRGAVLIAYHLPMRQSEILNLKWEEIDFRSGFIRLGGDRTKNKEGRVIPLHPEVGVYLKNLPRPIQGGYVFPNRRWCRKSYLKAVKAAGLGDFTFHDLRHCAINNLRLAGNDHYLIKQASGHKTDIAFRRYNLVTEAEMKRMKWYSKTGGDSGMMDTYMDTTAKIES